MKDLQKLLSNYDDCPDMKVWIQEQLLAGAFLKMANRDSLLYTNVLVKTNTPTGALRGEKLKIWSNQRVWKVQLGTAYRTSMPTCYVQTRTLAEAFKFFRDWYDNPPPRRG